MKKITVFLVVLAAFAGGAYALPAAVGVNNLVQPSSEVPSPMEIGNHLTLAENNDLFAHVNGTPLTTQEAQFMGDQNSS